MVRYPGDEDSWDADGLEKLLSVSVSDWLKMNHPKVFNQHSQWWLTMSEKRRCLCGEYMSNAPKTMADAMRLHVAQLIATEIWMEREFKTSGVAA